MYNIQNLFKCRWVSALKMLGYIRQEFLQEAVRKNNFSVWIISVIIFAAELFNIARVLFWSKSGLGSRNNQIYFSMYCMLIFLAVLWLVLRHLLRRASVRAQWTVQYVMTCLILLWHLGLNTYDLYRDPVAGTAVLTTALMGLALLIQSPPRYSAVLHLAAYLLFRFTMAPMLETGDRLNLTITFVVALAVSLTHAHHTAVMLKQQKQVADINVKLRELVQRDPLTGLLNKTTVECWADQVLQSLETTTKPDGLTLFLIDLDEFKGVNDRYGHPCGDHVLVETAEAMRCVFSDAAGLGRIGGDEFAVLYDRPVTEGQAVALSRELLGHLTNIQWQDQPLGVRCSVGACICTQPRYSYQQLYTETDRMLYRAKEAGRGRCCVRQLEHTTDDRLEEVSV